MESDVASNTKKTRPILKCFGFFIPKGKYTLSAIVHLLL